MQQAVTKICLYVHTFSFQFLVHVNPQHVSMEVIVLLILKQKHQYAFVLQASPDQHASKVSLMKQKFANVKCKTWDNYGYCIYVSQIYD